MTAAPSPPAPPTDRRTLMVGKGWVQAVALVVIFGFFVMGILAYRTYTASMPQPERVVTGTARRSSPGRTSPPVRSSSSPRPDAVRVDRRARRLPRAGLHRRLPASRGRLRRDAAARRRYPRPARGVIDEFRTNRYDEATDPDVHRQPGQGLRGQHEALRRVLRRGLHQERPGPRDQRPDRGPPADGLLRLDRMGGGGRAARGTPTPTPTTGRRSRGWTTARRPTWSCGACCRWSCCSAAPASCSPSTAAGAQRSAGTARRRRRSFREPGEAGTDCVSARDGWFFFVIAGYSWSRRCWGRRPSTTELISELLRLRSRAAPAVQRPGPGTCSSRCSGPRRASWPPGISRRLSIAAMYLTDRNSPLVWLMNWLSYLAGSAYVTQQA